MFGSEILGLRAGESTSQFQPSVSGYWNDDGWWVDTADPWKGDASRYLRLPAGFDDLEPGPLLAAVVWSVDRSRLSGFDLIRLLEVEARLVSHFQAGFYLSISEVSTLVDSPDSGAAEVAAVLHLTRAASEAEYGMALALARFPRVRIALAGGEIDLRRARVLIDSTAGLPEETANEVIARVLPHASNLTTGQLRARLSRLRMELDAESARVQYRAALQDRRIVVEANPDGTANLLAYNLAPEKVMAIRRRLNQLARQAKTPGDDRTADQVRADVYTDLLTGTGFNIANGKATVDKATVDKATVNRATVDRATVDIVVDLPTLLEMSDTPAHIPGYGPVLAEIARKVVNQQTDCRWEYIVTDQGQPIATGTINRRPTTAMKRRLRALHPTCVWPGCRMPARESDIDHIKPWAKYRRTRLSELAPLCDHHHQLRDKGWDYRANPDGGFIFTSPLGHTYTTSGADPP